jgi:hypothetical protein
VLEFTFIAQTFETTRPPLLFYNSYSTACETQRRGLTSLSGPEGTPRVDSPATFSLIQAARAFLPPGFASFAGKQSIPE